MQMHRFQKVPFYGETGIITYNRVDPAFNAKRRIVIVDPVFNEDRVIYCPAIETAARRALLETRAVL